jgi:hypothetical protein
MAPPPSLTLAATFTPDPSSTEVAQELAELKFDDNGSAIVTLDEPATIGGKIVGQQNAPVPAQVLVSRASLVQGNPPVIVQTTTDSMGQFGIGVPKSAGPYTLTVLPRPPADKLYAPQTWSVDLSKAGNMTLCLGSGCPAARSLSLSGQIADPFGYGLAGARVSATDDNGAARSSIATTGDDGKFTLYLSPDVQMTDHIRIVAAPDVSSNLPTLFRAMTAGDPTDLEMRMPALPSAQAFSLPISGKSTSGTDMGIVGARVDFAADLGQDMAGTHALYSTSAVTDEHGLATVQLIPGTTDTNQGYAVTVTPPANSIFERTQFALVPVGPAPKGLGVLGQLELGLRPQLQGHLVGPDGVPVKGASISAQPSVAAANLGKQNAADLSAPMTITGSDGAFAVRVDPGVYDVELVPPPSDALARWSIDNRGVDTDVDLSVVPLPRAVMTLLRVLSHDGTPLQGVEVRVFAVAYDSSCPANMPCALPPRLRGDGVTAYDGTTPLLLPSP